MNKEFGIIISISVFLFLFIIFYIRYLINLFLIPIRIKKAITSLANNNIEKAVKNLSKVVAFDRGNPEANFLLADIFYKKKQYILAQMYLFDIIYEGRFNNKITEVMVREKLARIYNILGDYTKAFLQYSILIKNNKLSEESLKEGIRIFIQNNELKEAEYMLNIALRKRENDGELHYLNALIFYNKKNLPLAEKAAKKAINLNYKTFEVQLLLGKIYFLTGRYQLALKYLKNIPDKIFTNEEVEKLLGQIFYYVKDYNSAIKTLEKFLSKYKNTKEKVTINLRYILGCSYEATGNLDNAIKIWKSIVNDAPYFQPANDKLLFYITIIKDEKIKNFIVSPYEIFHNKCIKLLEHMDYSIEKIILKNESKFEVIANNQKDIHIFKHYYIVISRQTSQITLKDIDYYINNSKRFRIKYIVLIFPYFKDEIKNYCEENSIKVFDFTIFFKYGVL